jgi:archaemetzincin
MPFSRPDIATQRRAIGAHIPRKLRPLLEPHMFDPIPVPDEDDWLFERSGKGQTFKDYEQAWAPLRTNLKSTSRRKIYLQPIGTEKHSARFPDLKVLAAGVEAFFGLETKVLPLMSLSSLGAKGEIRRRGSQVSAGDINSALKRMAAMTLADAFSIAGVTMHDLYKGDFNYLFGLGGRSGGLGFGVFSFHRHDPASADCEFHHGSAERRPGDDAIMLRRAHWTLTHELGHSLGLKHCVYFSCLMQGANSLGEAEARIPDLCPVCLRKLLWATNCESREGACDRYERIARFYAQHPESFADHHEWILRRIAPKLALPEQPQECEVESQPDADGGAEGAHEAVVARAEGEARARPEAES